MPRSLVHILKGYGSILNKNGKIILARGVPRGRRESLIPVLLPTLCSYGTQRDLRLRHIFGNECFNVPKGHRVGRQRILKVSVPQERSVLPLPMFNRLHQAFRWNANSFQRSFSTHQSSLRDDEELRAAVLCCSWKHLMFHVCFDLRYVP